MSKDSLRTLQNNVCSKNSLKNWKRKELKGKHAFFKEATPITEGEIKRSKVFFFFFPYSSGCWLLWLCPVLTILDAEGHRVVTALFYVSPKIR